MIKRCKVAGAAITLLVAPAPALAQADIGALLKLGPASLCQVPGAGEELFRRISAVRRSGPVRLGDGMRANVVVARQRSGRAITTSYRATPQNKILWNGLPLVLIETSFVAIPESHGPTTRRLTFGGGVARLKALLAAQGQDAPATARGRQVDHGAYGATVRVDGDGETARLTCQTND